MKKLFKTTLVAASIAAVSGVAHAGNTNVVTDNYSLEGVSAVTTAQTSNAITYDLKAAYAVGDKITFTFSAGALDKTNAFPQQLNMVAVTTSGSEKAGAALGLLNSDANTATYRVTSLSQPTGFTDKTTIGNVLTFGTVKLAAAAIAAGNTTVTVSSETANKDVLDSGSDTGKSRTGTLTKTATEFGAIKVASADALDGVIQVASSRKALDTASDTLKFTVANPTTTGWKNLVTVGATTVKLKADLAGFDLTKGIGAVASTASGTVKYDDAAKEVTVTYTSQITTDTITITPPTTTKAVVLNAQDFTVSGEYGYGTNNALKASLSSANAGEWTLNGAVVNVPYMPYSANASQIIYVTNAGSLAGDISVTAFDDQGNSYDLGVIGVSAAGKITKITKEVQDALLAKGFTAGKVSLTITVNAQDKDVTVYAGYNVGGSDRGFVNTSQYKGK